MEQENKLPHIPTGEELEIKPPEFLAADGWIDATLADELLDVTREYPIRYTLSINGTPFAPLGGLHGMTGQPGHGKTMTLSMVAAAVLGDTTHGMEWLLKDDIPNPRVLYIDTEMERGNTMLVNKRICAMLGWPHNVPDDRLTILCLREVTTAADRWRKVLKAIFIYEPTVVILDGLIDIVADFNDNTDCQELISKCMACASHYDISFWALLHENPGSEKMVGHAGSFLERKASDVMVTKKIKDETTGDVKFEVKNKKVRAKDWQSYIFVVDDSYYPFGVPRLADTTISEEPEEDDKFDVYSMTYDMLLPLQTLITDHEGISTRSIMDQTRELFKIGQGKAQKAINKAVEMGILLRGGNKRYYLPDLNINEDVTQF